ncbi:MAG: L,D-transpeptidase [Ignavibacteriales bacterium]|nr:L,D-transpeptidase [Ignavibacteriales bacterium]
MILYGIILNMGEISLDDAIKNNGLTQLDSIYIIIERNNYELKLFNNSTLIKTYKAIFGKNNSMVKTSSKDYVTPIGNYKICNIKENSKYHKFFQLDYPNKNDAAEGFKRDYINEQEYKSIISSLDSNNCPYAKTKLGADIGIQGIGEYNFIFKNLPFTYNWTNGSIAISNEDIDELYRVVKIGTVVVINY